VQPLREPEVIGVLRGEIHPNEALQDAVVQRHGLLAQPDSVLGIRPLCVLDVVELQLCRPQAGDACGDSSSGLV
jgi:hypothetical protein